MVSGWLDVRFSGQARHFVRVTWDGEVRLRFGRVIVGDVEGPAREILRRMPLVEEFWYFLLPPPGAGGEWPGIQPLPPGTPCWAPEVGRRRLFLAASTAAADWVAHRTPVRAFVGGSCGCPPLHPLCLWEGFFLSGMSRTGHHNHNGRSPADRCAHVILFLLSWKGSRSQVVVAVIGLPFTLPALTRVVCWRLPFA